MNVKDIINEGRPVEPYCFETDNEVTWYKIGTNDGYKYALEEFENNRLKACESQTEAESERELNFAIKFFEEHHRQPTYSDAIEITRKQMIDKACKTYCDLQCEKGMCGMCYHKHDHKGQIKNDFKYNECNELQLIRREMEERI